MIPSDAMQGWEIPSNLTNLHEYIERMQSRDSWKQTYYPPEKVCTRKPQQQSNTLQWPCQYVQTGFVDGAYTGLGRA